MIGTDTNSENAVIRLNRISGVSIEQPTVRLPADIRKPDEAGSVFNRNGFSAWPKRPARSQAGAADDQRQPWPDPKTATKLGRYCINATSRHKRGLNL